MAGPTEHVATRAPQVTLVERLIEHARAQPDREAASFIGKDGEPSARITRGELDRQARRLALALRQRCARGDRVLLLHPPGLEFVTAFVACLYAEVVAVPAPPPHPTRVRAALPRLAGMASDCAAALVLTTEAVRPALESACREVPVLGAIPWLSNLAAEDGAEPAWTPTVAAPEALAFLQYTSGSTSTPRGVMVSHGNLLANLGCIRDRLRLTPDSRFLNWQPHFHDMGLIGGILAPLFRGCDLMLMPATAVLQNPLRWLRTIDRQRVTHSGGPNFAFEACIQKLNQSAATEPTLDLSSWVSAFCGAEPLQARTVERFNEAFAPHGLRSTAFTPCYGLAESTLMSSSMLHDAQAEILSFSAEALDAGRAVPVTSGERRLVSCGSIVDEHQLAIVDPTTLAPCAPGEVGEIWLAGPSIARGYWNRPEESRATFEARLAASDSPAFLRTGDLGFAWRGAIFVTGRLKDLIIVAGRNHYPQDIEISAELSHAALRPGNAAAFSIEVEGGERLAIALELDRTLARPRGDDAAPAPLWLELMAAVRDAVAREHGVQVTKLVLLGPGGLPRTSSGKLRRHACRVLFEGSSLTCGALAVHEEPS